MSLIFPKDILHEKNNNENSRACLFILNRQKFILLFCKIKVNPYQNGSAFSLIWIKGRFGKLDQDLTWEPHNFYHIAHFWSADLTRDEDLYNGQPQQMTLLKSPVINCQGSNHWTVGTFFIFNSYDSTPLHPVGWAHNTLTVSLGEE